MIFGVSTSSQHSTREHENIYRYHCRTSKNSIRTHASTPWHQTWHCRPLGLTVPKKEGDYSIQSLLSVLKNLLLLDSYAHLSSNRQTINSPFSDTLFLSSTHHTNEKNSSLVGILGYWCSFLNPIYSQICLHRFACKFPCTVSTIQLLNPQHYLGAPKRCQLRVHAHHRVSKSEFTAKGSEQTQHAWINSTNQLLSKSRSSQQHQKILFVPSCWAQTMSMSKGKYSSQPYIPFNSPSHTFLTKQQISLKLHTNKSVHCDQLPAQKRLHFHSPKTITRYQLLSYTHHLSSTYFLFPEIAFPPPIHPKASFPSFLNKNHHWSKMNATKKLWNFWVICQKLSNISPIQNPHPYSRTSICVQVESIPIFRSCIHCYQNTIYKY